MSRGWCAVGEFTAAMMGWRTPALLHGPMVIIDCTGGVIFTYFDRSQ
jgi:hypothetical protein